MRKLRTAAVIAPRHGVVHAFNARANPGGGFNDGDYERAAADVVRFFEFTPVSTTKDRIHYRGNAILPFGLIPNYGSSTLDFYVRPSQPIRKGGKPFKRLSFTLEFAPPVDKGTDFAPGKRFELDQVESIPHSVQISFDIPTASKIADTPDMLLQLILGLFGHLGLDLTNSSQQKVTGFTDTSEAGSSVDPLAGGVYKSALAERFVAWMGNFPTTAVDPNKSLLNSALAGVPLDS